MPNTLAVKQYTLHVLELRIQEVSKSRKDSYFRRRYDYYRSMADQIKPMVIPTLYDKLILDAQRVLEP